MAETVIPVKLSKGETYEQDLQGHLEQSAEQLGSGIGNRPEPREGTFPAEKYTGGGICPDSGPGSGPHLALRSMGGG